MSLSIGLSILDLSKNIMYKFWYDCVKPKNGGKARLVSWTHTLLFST